MKARLRAWLEGLGDQFWLRPAVVVALCIAAAQATVGLETARAEGGGAWGYSGGAEGARALLGAVASSSIGVASTVFSITIAALSLASGQMGPRLLRNFIRDSRNQLALGVFVGTFAYALVVLRTVRTEQEGAFVPHAAVTGAIFLAMTCVATLVWYVHHIATGINVEQVIDVVHVDFVEAIEAALQEKKDRSAPCFEPGHPVVTPGSGYLQAVDHGELADWAAKTQTQVRLTARPGDYIPPGFPIGETVPRRDEAGQAFSRACTFGSQPAALQDLEYSVRQLTEIAVRALSPGINDPFTAGSVLERFGDALCRISQRHLPSGAIERGGDVVLWRPVTDYGGLCDAMFHAIRQNGSSSAFVLIRLLDVLTKVARVEGSGERLKTLLRHAELAFEAGQRDLRDRAALADMNGRYEHLQSVMNGKFGIGDGSGRREEGT